MKENWTYKKLGEVCVIERGGSPRPIEKYITNDECGLNWIKIGDAVEGSKYIYSTKEKIKPEGLKKTRFVNKGDFILSNSMSFGKPYILGIDGCIHDGWLVIRDKNEIFNKSFLYYVLGSQNMYQEFKRLAVGGVVNNLNSQLVRNVVIPIPPMEEQERIVAELDLLQSVIDKKKAQLDEYDKLAQSIFYEMFGDPIDNPKKWEVKKLGEVCEYAKTRICSNDISINNYVGVDNLLQKCKGKTAATKVPKDLGLTKYVEGDVLVGNIRPYLKKIWLADCCGGCNGDVLAIRRKTQYEKDIETAFLFKYLSTDMFFEFTMQYAKGEKMPRGDKKEIMKYPIPLPPLSLQQSFAEKIEAIEHQKELVKQSLNEVKTLFDSRMDYYFN